MFPTDNDAVVLGILCTILALVFYTANHPHRLLRRFYGVVPPLLLCYFLPSLVTRAGVWNPEESQIYFFASRYLLPASLVLLTLSLNLPAILRLGPKAVGVFLAGTLGVVAGGVASLLFMKHGIWDSGDPSQQDAWKGMATVAGSWIGGGANQTAMKEMFDVGDQMFSAMIAVDVLVANVWMACLLFCIPRARRIDRLVGADPQWFEELKARVAEGAGRARAPAAADWFALLAAGFGVTALAHLGAGFLSSWIQENAPYLAQFSLTSSFFWLVVIATGCGILLSFTPAARLEEAGASRMGTVFLYLLVASIGMKMDIGSVYNNANYFLMGGVWILVHAAFVVGAGFLLRAPFFLIAVGSQANIGGAVSAPVVAGSFHPKLAPVGVLLAVLGYGVGTYAAYACAQLMRILSQ